MKTSELTGAALDWAVAKCEGVVKGDSLDVGFIREGGYSPSTDWAQGGPIIERETISTTKRGSTWTTRLNRPQDGRGPIWGYGPTPLIAAMRCYVASKLGDTLDIPKELQCHTTLSK
jgi:hypothetical protein